MRWLTEYNSRRSITDRVLPAVLLLTAVGWAAKRFVTVIVGSDISIWLRARAGTDELEK